jgi:hypothetical protein
MKNLIIILSIAGFLAGVKILCFLTTLSIIIGLILAFVSVLVFTNQINTRKI